MDRPKILKIQRLVSTFIAASSGIQTYLQRREMLSATQWESISLAVSLIQFYIERGRDTKSIGVNARKAAAVLGRLGGLKGGKARARKLSARQRGAIAKFGASTSVEQGGVFETSNLGRSRFGFTSCRICARTVEWFAQETIAVASVGGR